MKRILIIVGILVAAVAIVTIGMLLRDKTSKQDPSGTLPDGGTLPIAGNNNGGTTNNGGNGGIGNNGDPSGATGGLPVGGVSAVAQAAVMDYAVNAGGITFIASNGSIVSVSTTNETIGQANFGTVLGAWFSSNGKWLLVKSGSSDVATWNLMDVPKKTWKTIQVNTSEMVWSQNGTQLAYLARRTNGSNLSTYTPATGATRTLLSLSAPDLTVRWKDSAHILIMDKPNSLVPGTIWDFSVATSKLTQFATNVSGADVLWGGPLSGGLLFKAGPTGGTLTMVNSAGNAVQSTSFLTMTSKCVFGETAATSTIRNIQRYLFCGIPQNQAIIKESQLPEDYLKGKFGTADTLYAINLIGGTLKSIIPASQNSNFDVSNVEVYGDSLYFVNRNDRKLYKVSLSALAGGAD